MIDWIAESAFRTLITERHLVPLALDVAPLVAGIVMSGGTLGVSLAVGAMIKGISRAFIAGALRNAAVVGVATTAAVAAVPLGAGGAAGPSDPASSTSSRVEQVEVPPQPLIACSVPPTEDGVAGTLFLLDGEPLDGVDTLDEFRTRAEELIVRRGAAVSSIQHHGAGRNLVWDTWTRDLSATHDAEYMPLTTSCARGSS